MPDDQPPARPPSLSTQPAARQPTYAPQQPAARARPVATVEARVAQPGDKICGNCGEANDPTRKFCRRCGTSLAAAVVEKPVPWWRRLFQRKPKTYAAGERRTSTKPEKGRRKRPSVGRILGLARWLIPLLMIVGAAGIIAVPSWRQAAFSTLDDISTTVRRFISPEAVQVRPIAASASSELADRGAGRAIDRGSNTDWQSGEASPTITITFQEPIDLWQVLVTTGSPDKFVELRRPRMIELTFSDGSTATAELGDDPKPQAITAEATATQTVTIRIVSTYAATGVPDAAVAITELEFFVKR